MRRLTCFVIGKDTAYQHHSVKVQKRKHKAAFQGKVLLNIPHLENESLLVTSSSSPLVTHNGHLRLSHSMMASLHGVTSALCVPKVYVKG